MKLLRFDVERFVEDCQDASMETGDAQGSVQEILARAVSNPGAMLAGLGAPQSGGIQTLYRSVDLTILNIVWGPLMQLRPHAHGGMWSLIGIYTGREDNIFWHKRERGLEATSAQAIGVGYVVPLSGDTIHSVINPIDKLTGAVHIYGGDFFATPRSEWDPETLAEQPWDLQAAARAFEQSNERLARGSS